MSSLSYRLDVRQPEQRRILIRLVLARDAWASEVDAASPTGGAAGTLFAPVWTPGSYLIREFARHFGPVVARDADRGTPLPCTKVSKNRYRVMLAAETQRIEVSYSVYAHELTVRTADVTPDHAFWNHANVLLWPVGKPDLHAQISVQVPPGWQIECPLERSQGPDGEATFLARGLDEALDSPCLAGVLTTIAWTAGGVPHRAVFDGLSPVAPPERLLEDLGAVTAAAIGVFGTVPYREYAFLCLFADHGHGGLEHQDCSVLLAGRTALREGKSYRDFLGLAAHELFHAWNVKRMRPAELWHFDYEAENYTRMLWLAEGFTAYYDDLLCQRAGVLTADEYLAIVARNLTSMLSGHGRLHQSLEEASYDAWVRFYRPDENTRNSTQNYYVNGALVGMCWDLTIRTSSRGRRSLDDFMRALWQRTFQQGRGYTQDDVESCLRETLDGDDATAQQLLTCVREPLQLDLGPLLERVGLRLLHKDTDKAYLGVGFREGGTFVAHVNDDSPASSAGIAPGDEVLALDGLRVTHESWSQVFQTVGAVGRELEVLLSSRGRLCERTVVPSVPPVGACAIETIADAGEEAVVLRGGWLRQDAPAPPG